MDSSQQQIQGEELKYDENEILIPANSKILYLRKLYFFLTLQLVVACLSIYFIESHVQEIKKKVKVSYVLWISLGVCLGLMLFSFIFRKAASVTPVNFGIYLIFTTAFAALSTLLGDYFQVDYVFMVMAFLTSLALSLFFYVSFTKSELTFQGASIFIFSAIFISLQMICLFTDYSLKHIILVTAIAVVWGYYLVYETQAYVTPSFNITESGLLSEDSVSGSILVYMDVFVLLLTTADLIRQTIIKYR